MRRNADSRLYFPRLNAKLLDPILETAGLRKRFSGKQMRWSRDLEEYVLGEIRAVAGTRHTPVLVRGE